MTVGNSTRDAALNAALGSVLTALKKAPVGAGKRRGNVVGSQVPPAAIAIAAKYLAASDVIRMIVDWIKEDSAGTRPGGRPQTVSPHSLLVAALACAIAGLPVSYVQIQRVLCEPTMSTVTRQHLGLPVAEHAKKNRSFNRPSQRIGYHSVARTFKKVAETIDPKVYPTYRGLTIAEIEAIDASRDPADVAKRQLRMDKVNAAMLLTGWEMLPGSVRAAWGGDVTIDATVVPVFGRRGPNTRRRAVPDAQSPEVNAYWHAKTQDKRDAIDSKTPVSNSTEYTFGYDAHLLLATGPCALTGHPELILGFSPDRPGRAPGLNAVAMLQSLHEAGLPKGLVTVDLGYSQLKPKNFHRPLRALGYGLNIMYKVNELGLQATYEGALLVDGTWFGACLPSQFIDLSKDKSDHRIDDEVYKKRLTERAKYAMRLKGMSSNGTGRVFRCPAQGIGCTLNCPFANRAKPDREAPKKRRGGPKPVKRTNVIDPPKDRLKVCTNRHSLTIPVTKGVRYYQEIPYKTAEWDEMYKARRNRIEGQNRVLKNAATTAIALADHRRFRGLGKQNIALAMKMVAANMAAIVAFLDWQQQNPVPPPNKGGRPVSVALSQHLTPADAPIRIAGRAWPGEAA